MIEANGSTSLTEVGDHFFLYDGSGSGPSLKYAGADVVAGQFGAWTPIGAEQTASGYEVAWKITGADQYTVWNTDSSGNYISNLVGAVSGTSSALESLEPSFHQDLNGDGQIGTVMVSNPDTTAPTVAITAPTGHSVRHCDRFRQRLGQRRRCRRAVLPGWRPARHRGHHRSLQRELEHDHGDERQPHAAGSCPRCGRQHHQFAPAHGHGFQPDTTAPTVAITAPTGTLSGIVTVTANASDNVGVAGVQFYLDGALLGTEDTTTPYSVSWNTTTATNASHTLLARARDAAGNITNSAPLTVTVSNTQSTPIVGLPADRLYDWNPGLNSVGGVPDRTTVFTTVFPGGDIQAAIDACPPGEVVQLAAGTFTVNNYLLIDKGITLRGAVDPVTNAPLTFLQKTNGATAGSYTAPDYQPIIIVGPNRYPQIGTSTNLTSDAVAGTYSITLASTAGLSPGQFVLLDEDDYTSASFIPLPNRNGSPTSAEILASDRVVFMDHSPSDPGDDPFPDSLTWFSRAGRPLNEIKEIASISGNTVTFTSPITITTRSPRPRN